MCACSFLLLKTYNRGWPMCYVLNAVPSEVLCFKVEKLCIGWNDVQLLGRDAEKSESRWQKGS